MGTLSLRCAGWLVLVLTGCSYARSHTGPQASARGSRMLPQGSCASPMPLSFGAPIRASTREGSDVLRASCVRGSAPECVFTLDVDRRSELRVALETAELDGALVLYERGADGAAARELRCVDDTPSGDTHHARLDVTLGAGHYLLAVDGAGRQSGELELFAELEPLARIDDVCERPPELAPGMLVRESTRGGTNLFSATCAGGAQGPEHVHAIRLEEPARVRVRQQSDFDGSLYLRARCEDASTELVCNDDFQSNARSMIAARLPAGTFYVFSDSYAREQSGEYVLSLERVSEPAARTHDAVCAEVGLDTAYPGQRELDTLSGTFAFAGSCGGKDTPESAVTLRVDGPTTLVARLEDVEFNAVMYVRKVCADAGSEVACYVAPRVDRPPSEAEMSSPALVVPLDRGVYTLVVDGYEAGDLGAATLRLFFTP